MKAEISNIADLKAKRFTSVVYQLSRMRTDWDDNAAEQIRKNLLDSVSQTALGSGTPAHDGLIVQTQASGQPMQLAVSEKGGKVVADGVIGSLRTRGADVAGPYMDQADLPLVSNPNLRKSDFADGKGLLYADIWDKTVTAFDDGELLDVALHGADTTAREQRSTQLKIAKATDLIPDSDVENFDPCKPAFKAGRVPEIGNGIFDLVLQDATTLTDDCDPCATLIDLDEEVGNHLFRLEVHHVGYKADRSPNRLVLKYSKENGARRFARNVKPENEFVYEHFSADGEQLMGMPSDDWQAANLYKPAQPAKSVRGIFRRSEHPSKEFVRRWDGFVDLKLAATGVWGITEVAHGVGDPTAASIDVAGKLTLDFDGMTLTLEIGGKQFLAGDAWFALLRNRAPSSPDDQRIKVISPTPLGIRHHYCVLGRVEIAGREPTVGTDGTIDLLNGDLMTSHDRRRLQFPALTCLGAEDVGYETVCPTGLFDSSHDTVEKALNRVCEIKAMHVGYSTTCESGLFGTGENTVKKALDKVCEIKAMHVGYSTTCESGLFGTGENTVKKALDKVCEIKAEHIGFNPECEYLRGKEVTKVDQALEALCAITAEQIDFNPKCEYLRGKEVTKVDQALEALCERKASGTGVECAVKVRPDEFRPEAGFPEEWSGLPTLKEALQAHKELPRLAAAARHPGLAIEFMPGSYRWPSREFGEFFNLATFCLKGCCAGQVEIHFHRNLMLEGCRMVKIEDLEIVIRDKGAKLEFIAADQIAITRSFLRRNANPTVPILRLQASKNIDLEGSRIVVLDRTLNFLPKPVLGGPALNMALAGVVMLTKDQAGRLGAAAPQNQKRTIVNNVLRYLHTTEQQINRIQEERNTRLNNTQKLEIYMGSRMVARLPEMEKKKITGTVRLMLNARGGNANLSDVVAIGSVFAGATRQFFETVTIYPAVQIVNAQARTAITDTVIEGHLVLGDQVPRSLQYTNALLGLHRKRDLALAGFTQNLRSFAIPRSMTKSCRVRDCRLLGLVPGALEVSSLIDWLKNPRIRTSSGAQPSFRHLFIDNTTVMTGDNLIQAGFVNLSGNRFDGFGTTHVKGTEAVAVDTGADDVTRGGSSLIDLSLAMPLAASVVALRANYDRNWAFPIQAVPKSKGLPAITDISATPINAIASGDQTTGRIFQAAPLLLALDAVRYGAVTIDVESVELT